uniref:WT1 interacting protein n=1 Tax=Latimeria chalumnae TaxID=7897 RepID=H3A5I9_LATCH
MEKHEDAALKASKFIEDLSLYETCRDGLYNAKRDTGIQADLEMISDPKTKNVISSATQFPHLSAMETYQPGSKVYNTAAFRASSGNRGGTLDEGICTKSEVALPCYSGISEKNRRFSLEAHRYSSGSAYDGVISSKTGSHPLYPLSRSNTGSSGNSDVRYNATSPRTSLASSASSSQEHSKHSSPRSSIGSSVLSYDKYSSPRSSLVVSGQDRYISPRCSLVQNEGSVLSPRSSYASTTSDTSKHSSPRTSLNIYDCGSKPSSNRTSGISMGYDQRHISPRSSTASQYSCTTSPRSSYSDSRYMPSVNSDYDHLIHGMPVVSPRSSICSQDGRSGSAANSNPSVISPRSSISSHSSRSSRSSRGSMSAYLEFQLPSPRSSMLGPSLQEGLVQEVGDAAAHVLSHTSPRHDQQQPVGATVDVASGATICFNPTKGSNAAQKLQLPYQVTPSRDSGPSQAERRLEALTLELEKELEMQMKKEYFGICIKCGKGVYGASQACQAMGNLYHTNCFTCCSCEGGRRLRGKAFYNVNGKVYCEEDFLYSGFQQTADKCFVCGHLIMEMILQALGKSYHPGCFRCVVCNECLDGVPFTVDVENNIYCVKDYHTVFAPKCASCNQPILPAQGSEETIRVVSMDKDYHVECYHCEDCGLQLNDEEGHRCYPLDGHLLCHSCHIQRLSIQVPQHPAPSYPMHVTEL